MARCCGSKTGRLANAQLGGGAGLVGDVTGDGVPDQVMGAIGAGPFGGAKRISSPGQTAVSFTRCARTNRKMRPSLACFLPMAQVTTMPTACRISLWRTMRPRWLVYRVREMRLCIRVKTAVCWLPSG
jgi:hypothetical protein